jgi:hypothetical protein
MGRHCTTRLHVGETLADRASVARDTPHHPREPDLMLSDPYRKESKAAARAAFFAHPDPGCRNILRVGSPWAGGRDLGPEASRGP